MSYKKLSLLLATALMSTAVLVAPAVSLVQTNDSTTVLAAVAPSSWEDKAINKTIHTKNATGLAVFDEAGNAIDSQNAKADTDYIATVEHTDNNGNVYYKVSDGHYLSADELTEGRPVLVKYNVHAVVHTLNFKSIPLYDGNGDLIDGESVKGNQDWYTNIQINNEDTGVSYYQISENRYVSSEYISTYRAIK